MSVQVEGLTKHFPGAGTPAVSQVSFGVPAGAITTLLGPSGAGKSTVLRLIAGLEQPDAGRVSIDGVDCTRASVQERNVGFVFQSYALFQNLDVRQNVAFGMAVRGRPREETDARVRELLALVQLSEYADRMPGQLSGGQRQRVAFARALATRPKVLLLDEPFGALDSQVRHELREWLHRLHEETGVTTVLVTHDQAEALELSQHVVVMQDGRVAQAGPPHEIYDRPASAFVASFIGGANLLPGSGRGRSGGGAPGAFVRPHDVKLARPSSGSDPAAAGRVLGLKRVGGTMRVSVAMPDGSELATEMSWAEAEALALREGDRVAVDLRAARDFVEDYSI